MCLGDFGVLRKIFESFFPFCGIGFATLAHKLMWFNCIFMPFRYDVFKQIYILDLIFYRKIIIQAMYCGFNLLIMYLW